MTHYSFATVVPLRKSSKYHYITVHFDYHVPKQFGQWQHPEYTSLRLIETLDNMTNTPIPSLEIEDIIMLRRCCWNYLEHNHLLLNHNINPLFN